MIRSTPKFFFHLLTVASRLRVFYAVLVGCMSLPVLAATWSGKVTQVSDGDTVWVRPHPHEAARPVRLDGIDAPEICQAYGPQARAALASRVLGQRVQLVVRRYDNYGRALAQLNLGGEDIGGWMVSQGHAWSYRYRKDPGPYAAVQARAQAARAGLFAQAQPMEPRDFRRRHGSCH